MHLEIEIKRPLPACIFLDCIIYNFFFHIITKSIIACITARQSKNKNKKLFPRSDVAHWLLAIALYAHSAAAGAGYNCHRRRGFLRNALVIRTVQSHLLMGVVISRRVPAFDSRAAKGGRRGHTASVSRTTASKAELLPLAASPRRAPGLSSRDTTMEPMQSTPANERPLFTPFRSC